MTLVSPFERRVAAQQPKGRTTSPAERTLTLEPHDFAYDWPERPAQDVIVGLRTPTITDMERAQADSRMKAAASGEEAGRQALMAYAVARGICDPNDFRKPHPLFELAEDRVPRALTMRAIERILEALADMVSPIRDEASDEEVASLWRMLACDGALDDLPPARASDVRHHLKIAFELMIE